MFLEEEEDVEFAQPEGFSLFFPFFPFSSLLFSIED